MISPLHLPSPSQKNLIEVKTISFIYVKLLENKQKTNIEIMVHMPKDNKNKISKLKVRDIK